MCRELIKELSMNENLNGLYKTQMLTFFEVNQRTFVNLNPVTQIKKILGSLLKIKVDKPY